MEEGRGKAGGREDEEGRRKTRGRKKEVKRKGGMHYTLGLGGGVCVYCNKCMLCDTEVCMKKPSFSLHRHLSVPAHQNMWQ